MAESKSKSQVSNSFVELANEMKRTYPNGSEMTTRKTTEYREVIYDPSAARNFEFFSNDK